MDLDEEEEGYYSSADEEGEITEDMAARGVGQAGAVRVAWSPWGRMVPGDLIDTYKRQI